MTINKSFILLIALLTNIIITSCSKYVEYNFYKNTNENIKNMDYEIAIIAERNENKYKDLYEKNYQEVSDSIYKDLYNIFDKKMKDNFYKNTTPNSSNKMTIKIFTDNFVEKHRHCRRGGCYYSKDDHKYTLISGFNKNNENIFNFTYTDDVYYNTNDVKIVYYTDAFEKFTKELSKQ